jgi:hypothetical protein
VAMIKCLWNFTRLATRVCEDAVRLLCRDEPDVVVGGLVRGEGEESGALRAQRVAGNGVTTAIRGRRLRVSYVLARTAAADDRGGVGALVTGR